MPPAASAWVALISALNSASEIALPKYFSADALASADPLTLTPSATDLGAAGRASAVGEAPGSSRFLTVMPIFSAIFSIAPVTASVAVAAPFIAAVILGIPALSKS